MKIGIFSNYEFNYETMEVKGSGVYRYQLDMSKKRGETTDRDLFHLMSDLKDFLQLKNNWNRGRDKDILQSMTKIYGLLGICSSFKLDSFTKDFEDDKKIYYVDYEKIDLEYIQNEIEAFNKAFVFFKEKVGFSESEPTPSDKRTFLELLQPSKKHITFDLKLDKIGKPVKEIRADNMLGVAYIELEKLFFRNSKIRKCGYRKCGKTYVSSRTDNKCCSPECAYRYRRDKSRIKTAYMEGRKMPYYTNLYDDQVINEWIESI